ncbi:MAG: FtsX-like permease family protein [Bdellovibrionales bacterium]|nr:FtsX-like permease family protein [Bdellovibrionales bacterium]
MRYETFIGIRYLLSRKRHKLISLITLISIVGVAVGVMALNVVLSVVSGFEHDFQKKILGNNAPLILFKTSESIQNEAELSASIDALPGVTGTNPFLYSEVLARSESGQSSGMVVYGIDPKRIVKVTSLETDMTVGSVDNLYPSKESPYPGIIVGHELANGNLFLYPGAKVDLISPQSALNPFGFGPKMKRFEVVGIFKSGLYEYDAKSAYILLDQAQSFFRKKNQVAGIQINVEDLSKSREMIAPIQQAVGDQYFIRHWMEMNADLFNAFKLEKTTFFIVLTMIILVASFNIVGTLTLLVLTKGKEIAILKAMGASRISIARIFVTCGTLIGSVGMLLGIGIGYLLCLLLKYYIRFPLNSDVYQIDTLPVLISPFEFALVGLSALLISFLATLYPALRAARLSPSEGLRYE